MDEKAPEGAREGKVRHHGKFAFLLAQRPGEEDLMLRGPSLRLAMDGDRVRARLVPGAPGRPVGEIVAIVARARDSVTGVLRRQGQDWAVVPEGADERDAVSVLGFGPDLSPQEGQLVVARITRWPSLQAPAGAEVVEALGPADEPGTRLRAALRARGIGEDFPEPVLAESRALPDAVSPGMREGRLDLRGLPVFALSAGGDEAPAAAFSLEVLNPRVLRLGVHAADASYHVRAGTALDAEAGARAVAVRWAGRRVPLLPPALSDGLCRFPRDVERLALSCFIDVDAAGKVRGSSFKETVVVRGREVSSAELEAPAGEDLLRLRALFKALSLQRRRRGGLDLAPPEYRVELDAEGLARSVSRRPRLESLRLAEEFELLAAECAARALSQRRVPFLSRVQPDPDPRKLALLGETLKAMGVYVPASLAASPGRALQIVLQKAAGLPLEDTVRSLVLRSLRPAGVSAAPGSHFSLACAALCRFTSAASRYEDLVNQRALKAWLRHSRQTCAGTELKDRAVHCTQRERQAAEAERLGEDILRAQLLKERVGEVFSGVVSGAAGFGAFVTLPGLGACGLARGAKAALGSPVRVRLDRVDEAKGVLDFSLPAAPERPASRGRPSGRKPRR